MSIRVMSAVWDKFPGSGSSLLTMLALADWSDDVGRCFPSVSSIANKVRLSSDQARRVVHQLIDSGFVAVIAGKTGGRMSRRYQINLDSLTPCTDASPSTDASPALAPMPAQPLHSHASRTVIEPSINHQPIPEAKKPPRSKSVDSVPDGFAEFWEAYGKKNGKANTIAQWKKIKPDADLVQAIVSAAASYSAGREPQYRKDPERWLKGRLWLDDLESTGANGSMFDLAAGAI